MSRNRGHTFSDWFGFVFFLVFAGFLFWRAPRLGLLMLPGVLHELLTAVCFLLRRNPKARLSGLGPRIAAYGATFLVPGLMITMTARYPGWPQLSRVTILQGIGLFTWSAGIPLMLFGLWNLRHSFSIEPQARELVTGGPYKFARHPIYAGYLLQYLGTLLGHLNLVLGIGFLAWLLLVIIRIRNEERVLSATFPQYRLYQRQVGMFAPRFSIRRAMLRRTRSRIRPAA